MLGSPCILVECQEFVNLLIFNFFMSYGKDRLAQQRFCKFFDLYKMHKKVNPNRGSKMTYSTKKQRKSVDKNKIDCYTGIDGERFTEKYLI